MKVLGNVLFVLCYRKNEVEVNEMMKLRLQGTKNEIRWFIRLLRREPRVNLENTPTFFSSKGTERYKRLYTQVNLFQCGIFIGHHIFYNEARTSIYIFLMFRISG